MRLVVQVPCLNEAETIGQVIRDIRDATRDMGEVLILVVDDGSTDGTATVAQQAGADRVVRHRTRQGLARAFSTGLAHSLNLAGDIIVNTDGDNQYVATGIRDLIAPIVEGQADIVIGSRPINGTAHFSPLKKSLQRLGSSFVRALSGTSVADATSGFRAFHRDAALRMNSFSDYTYTLETLIQAGRSGMRVASVPIRTNAPTRQSRLIKSLPSYVWRSALDMLRVFAVYAPLRTYILAGLAPLVLAVMLGLRYLVLIFFFDPTRSHAPSLILASILTGLGLFLWGMGIIGQLLSINRRLLEDIQSDLRARDADKGRLRSRVATETVFDRGSDQP